jgi:hypothetical protein
MENTMDPYQEYLCSLIGMSCDNECEAINIANAICELAGSIHRPSFVEQTKKEWHAWKEQPMLEHYGVTDKVKEYTHE